MNLEKQYDFHSETSNEETEKSSDETSRFYECNFCKRGFTNAQALGGHMNIHRKEKAKTKPKTKRGGKVSNESQDDGYGYGYGGVINPEYYSAYSTDHQAQYYAVPQQLNYQYYYPSSSPSGFPVAYHMMSDFSAPDDHLSIYEDHGISNLSLRIDGAHHEVAGGSWTENEIDLELHL